MSNRCYYHNTCEGFILDTDSHILGELSKHHNHALEDLQRNAWLGQIAILKHALKDHPEAHLFFEYAIPRMGKRVDNVILLGNKVLVIEFKVGTSSYERYAIDQAIDYAVDLKNFHESSHDLDLIPVVIPTHAEEGVINFTRQTDGVYEAICINRNQLGQLLSEIELKGKIDPMGWSEGRFKPTPTIVEAAQALFAGHEVEEISRSDSGTINLSRTTQCILEVAQNARRNGTKSICFMTGVPGAGKTLAGLHLAIQQKRISDHDHSVFLSGNGPLVYVLREALARDQVKQAKEQGEKLLKKEAERKANAFIQNIHHFRDESLGSDKPPIEHMVVFDEAQRAWDKKKASQFIRKNRGLLEFDMSEPEFLISAMDRHEDWSVIVCLIGGGQEINTGEAGLEEWFSSLKSTFPNWEIHYSDLITNNDNYLRDPELKMWVEGVGYANSDLHLGVSVRSFRSENLSAFVKQLLDVDCYNAKNTYVDLVKPNYPIVVTRDIAKAKSWLKSKARGNERFGLVASSDGIRLRPLGINVKAEIDAPKWFLNPSDDIRSSFFCEEVATEFDIQGLELDWVGVCWDGDLYMNQDLSDWIYRKFSGTKWQNIKSDREEVRRYLKNAYRVLLTRARQGMVILIPEGDDEDVTRKAEFYDFTIEYLKSLGIDEI
ncbi:DUF2075 domain-containing protein [Flavobacteriales bacterium]|nr:DUF2075 domain-containing protein [Flavobacteriales bacterium]